MNQDSYKRGNTNNMNLSQYFTKDQYKNNALMRDQYFSK